MTLGPNRSDGSCGGLAWQTHRPRSDAEPGQGHADRQPAVQWPGVKQYPERFDGYEQHARRRLPDRRGVPSVPRRPDTCPDRETAYNTELIAEANRRGIRTCIQHNVEFLDHLNKPDLPVPTKFLSPSFWHMDVMQGKFGDGVVHLPPPTFPEDFARAREANLSAQAAAVPPHRRQACARRPQRHDAPDARHAAQPGGL